MLRYVKLSILAHQRTCFGLRKINECDASVCFQAGPSEVFPALHQSVLPVGSGRMLIQQRGGVSAAASLSGRHARRGVRVLVYYQ